jgi:hypothetical protein
LVDLEGVNVVESYTAIGEDKWFNKLDYVNQNQKTQNTYQFPDVQLANHRQLRRREDLSSSQPNHDRQEGNLVRLP